MPHYEFFCHACKKMFSKILTIAAHEKAKIACPHCGSHKIELGRLLRGHVEEECVKARADAQSGFDDPVSPDGHVLILGGYGVDGKIVQTAEMIYFTGTL